MRTRTKRKKSRFYKAGKLAFKQNLPVDSVPYSMGTFAYEEWSRGWIDASDEAYLEGVFDEQK